MDADHRLATLRAFASLIPEKHHPDDLTRALRAGSTIRALKAFEKAATDPEMNARLEAERSVSFAQLAPALRAIDHSSSPSARSMTPAMWVTVVAAAAIVGIYFVQFGASFALSSSRDEWGTFGDYIGGLLNPLIGAFTAFLTWQIAMTIQRMQDRTAREELRESAAQAQLLEQTRKEQERESREAIREEARIQLAYDLFREWQSESMSHARDRANDLHKKHPNESFDWMESHPLDDRASMWAVVGFFDRLALFVSTGRVSPQLAVDLFGPYFSYWDGLCFREQVPATWRIKIRFENLRQIFDALASDDMQRWRTEGEAHRRERLARVTQAGAGHPPTE